MYAGKGYRSPRQLATNGACRDLLEHHERVLRTLRRDPAAFVSAVVAHCAALSSPAEPAPKTKLTLRAHHFDPSLLWGARSDACFICFSWLYDVYAAQVASNTPPFVDLPDDCAGDVFEFLPMTMAREELLHVVAHCSSPEAHAWICAVAAAAVMVILCDHLLQMEKAGIYFFFFNSWKISSFRTIGGCHETIGVCIHGQRYCRTQDMSHKRYFH